MKAFQSLEVSGEIFASRALLGARAGERKGICQSGAARSSVQNGAHVTVCQWECFKALASGGSESQEDVDGVECCARLRGVFHSWVRAAVRWCLGSLASAPPS